MTTKKDEKEKDDEGAEKQAQLPKQKAKPTIDPITGERMVPLKANIPTREEAPRQGL